MYIVEQAKRINTLNIPRENKEPMGLALVILFLNTGNGPDPSLILECRTLPLPQKTQISHILTLLSGVLVL